MVVIEIFTVTKHSVGIRDGGVRPGSGPVEDRQNIAVSRHLTMTRGARQRHVASLVV